MSGSRQRREATRVEEMVRNESNLDALKREVDWLRCEHVKLGREHREELETKDAALTKRRKQADKFERESTAWKRERYHLQASLRIANDGFERSGLEIGHLKRELTRLSAAEERVKELEEATAGDPNANLRLKIKQLLLKYHPDHVSTITLNNEDVTRDLVELLET